MSRTPYVDILGLTFRLVGNDYTHSFCCGKPYEWLLDHKNTFMTQIIMQPEKTLIETSITKYDYFYG